MRLDLAAPPGADPGSGGEAPEGEGARPSCRRSNHSECLESCPRRSRDVGSLGEASVRGSDARSSVSARPGSRCAGPDTAHRAARRGPAGKLTGVARRRQGRWSSWPDRPGAPSRRVQPQPGGAFSVTVRPTASARYRLAAGSRARAPLVQGGAADLLVPRRDLRADRHRSAGAERSAVEIQRLNGRAWQVVARTTVEHQPAVRCQRRCHAEELPRASRFRAEAWSPGQLDAGGASMRLFLAAIGVALALPGAADAAASPSASLTGTDVDGGFRGSHGRFGLDDRPFFVALEAQSARRIAGLRGDLRGAPERAAARLLRPDRSLLPASSIPAVRGFEAWAFRPAWPARSRRGDRLGD